eukprot:6752679-Ditylum_brightwellii.AAC.1
MPTSPLPKTKTAKGKEEVSTESLMELFDDDISRPSFINVGSPKISFEPVIDVSDDSFQPRKTTYKVVFKGEYGTKDEKEPTAENL